MRALGKRGGQSTMARHPGHLQEIAAAGGRAAKAARYDEECDHMGFKPVKPKKKKKRPMRPSGGIDIYDLREPVSESPVIEQPLEKYDKKVIDIDSFLASFDV